MNKLMTKIRKNKKGFTLAELLVVVAIIGVLVAVSIPVFGSALEKANNARDLANVRAAYAELLLDKMTDQDFGSGDPKITIALSDIVDKAGIATDRKTNVKYSGGAGGTISIEKAGSFKVDNDVTITTTGPSGT
ncbi:type II secretion system protein [uncultured Oscillibacter sp.]|uniref:type II secretion system protein n=1 Tax=uncultured Oscillibacter sp. TaxID=876091 RepID=UPI0025FDA47D|nr:type II secretion system protein [uncultured Oscillibacter sp.]